MLLVLGAIDAVPSSTLAQLAATTGLDKKTVSVLIRQAQEQAHVDIAKEGFAYTIREWGPVFKRSGAKGAFKQAAPYPGKASDPA